MKVTRRDLLAGAAGVVALGKTAGMQGPTAVPSDPSKVRGKPSRALGQRAASEKPLRQPRGVNSSVTPHQDLYGANFGVRPRVVRKSDGQLARGYRGEALVDAFSRYLAGAPPAGEAADA